MLSTQCVEPSGSQSPFNDCCRGTVVIPALWHLSSAAWLQTRANLGCTPHWIRPRKFQPEAKKWWFGQPRVPFWGEIHHFSSTFWNFKNYYPYSRGLRWDSLFYFVGVFLILWVLVYCNLSIVPVSVESVLYIFYVIFMATLLGRYYLLLSLLYGWRNCNRSS